jgi:hypothetical protein
MLRSTRYECNQRARRSTIEEMSSTDTVISSLSNSLSSLSATSELMSPPSIRSPDVVSSLQVSSEFAVLAEILTHFQISSRMFFTPCPCRSNRSLVPWVLYPLAACRYWRTSAFATTTCWFWAYPGLRLRRTRRVIVVRRRDILHVEMSFHIPRESF